MAVVFRAALVAAQSPRLIPHVDSSAMVIDGDPTDWGSLPPLLENSDFSPFPTSEEQVTTGPPPPTEDLAVSIWLGWSMQDGRIYVYARFVDDSLIPIADGWDYKGDQIQVSIDADQSGGPHYGFGNWEAAECEVISDPSRAGDIHNNRHAQTYAAYMAGDDSLDLRLSKYKDWATLPPLAETAFRREGNTAHVELAITPFDNLLPDRPVVYDGPPESTPSELHPSQTVSLDILLGDMDSTGGEPEWYLLSGHRQALLNPDYMPEFLLQAAGETAVHETGWGGVKRVAVEQR